MATNLEFIKRVEATSVTELDITDIFSANYDVYYVTIDFDRNNTQANIIRLLDNTGTVINTGYQYGVQQANLGGNTGSERKSSSDVRIVWLSYDQYGSGSFYVYNPFSSSSHTLISGNSIGGNYLWLGHGSLKATTSCTGLKFDANGATYNDIIVTVYGVK